MIVEEKLNNKIYLVRRGNFDFPGYRMIMWLQENETVDFKTVYKRNDLKLEKITSLCEFVSELAGVDHCSDGQYDEKDKENALCVPTGGITIKEFKEEFFK